MLNRKQSNKAIQKEGGQVEEEYGLQNNYNGIASESSPEGLSKTD